MSPPVKLKTNLREDYRSLMTFASVSQFHVYLQWVSCLAECLQCESVGVFNQKKALVGAFSLIAKACLKLYLPVPRLWALVPAQDYNLVLAAAAGWREGDSNQLKLVSASQSNNKLRMEIRLW